MPFKNIFYQVPNATPTNALNILIHRAADHIQPFISYQNLLWFDTLSGLSEYLQYQTSIFSSGLYAVHSPQEKSYKLVNQEIFYAKNITIAKNKKQKNYNSEFIKCNF